MAVSEENIELLRRVSKSADPLGEASAVIGLMAGVIAFHKSEAAAAQFLREAAAKAEGRSAQ
ncbi:hypothetical protein [Mesorhizobium sp. Pch-S]|uniref:hypothetical protein n=1 Tax=Mesorhizobium sp. Pch-S TaxID=2082387 RepID=UPI0010130CA4|nr:hypothetical protein [Mesorhizobium sp. Pch-S]QAZ45905.1 hypothetical protein C1M53_26325 [Mesorhizobium sp. Pch-S]